MTTSVVREAKVKQQATVIRGNAAEFQKWDPDSRLEQPLGS